MSRRTPRLLDRLPKDVRPLVGGAVLVAAVRAVDAGWRLIARRPAPTGAPTDPTSDATAGSGAQDTDRQDTDPAVIRDRLVHATLLGAALRLARRFGLPAAKGARRRRTGG